jgi:hypothetical protein
MAHYNHIFAFVQKKKERTVKALEPALADERRLLGAAVPLGLTRQ